RVGALSVVYITALQAGTILAALLAVPLADAYGWRVSLASWAATALVATLPWWWLLRRGLAEARAGGPAVDTHARAPPLRADVGIRPGKTSTLHATPVTRTRVWHTALGWGMALMFGMTSLATYAMFTWMPRIFTDVGASPAFGGAMVALYTGFSLLGGLVVPGLAVRMRNSFPMALACAAAQLSGFYGL